MPNRTSTSGCLIAALVLPLAFGCASREGATSSPQVDLLLHNGAVMTMAEVVADTPQPTAIAIDQGVILEVGGEELLESFEAASVIDLGGRFVMPGFIDGHTHIAAESKRYIDLDEVSSIEEMQSLVRDRAAELGPNEWITGYGWSEDELAELRRPLRDDLDEAAPNNPVVLTRAGGHSAIANSPALEAAGLNRDSPDPESGTLERAADGELNGIIRERQDLLLQLVPEASPGELYDSRLKNLRDLFRHGITSIVQASESIEGYRRWQEIYENEVDLPRASVQVLWPGARGNERSGAHRR